MNSASIEIGRYKIYYNEKDDIFDIYEVNSKFIGSYKGFDNARAKIKQLNDDDEINSEINRLNNIKEPERDRSWKSSFPANSNSVLHTPLSQKTKELLERIKQNEK